jgi:uncharacterized membrane protein YphA (DoxX/SURF4 family)
VTAKPIGASELVWACQILAAAQFFLTALDKLSGAPPMVQLFEAVGFGQWFRYVTGCIELAGAALLLMPSLATTGAALLSAVMIGALVAHFTGVVAAPPTRALILLAMLGVVLLWQRPARAEKHVSKAVS